MTARGVSDPAAPVPETASYPSGATKFTGFRLDGQPHGDWRWYRLDGSLMRTGSFERGTQVGRWQTFDRTGRLVKETEFKKAK